MLEAWQVWGRCGDQTERGERQPEQTGSLDSLPVCMVKLTLHRCSRHYDAWILVNEAATGLLLGNDLALDFITD